MHVQEVKNLVAAGKKTDADGTDRSITTSGFTTLWLDCIDSGAEMTFTIDEAIAGAAKPVYVKNGYTLYLNVSGSVLHYSGNGTFRYAMTV